MELINKIEIIKRNFSIDPRGYFLKIITGKENGLPKFTGEIYLTMAKPRESRGGHYHVEGSEWFTLISGAASMKLEDISTKERFFMKLTSSDPVTIMVPPNVAHLFQNESTEDFVLLAYTNTLYDPADTIVYPFQNPQE